MFVCKPIQEDQNYQPDVDDHEQTFTPLEFALGLHAIENSLKRNGLYTYKGKLTERGTDLKGFLDKMRILEADHKAIHGTPLIPGIVEENPDWDGPAQDASRA